MALTETPEDWTAWYKSIALQLAEQTGASTNETYLDVEEKARQLASSNPCLVPGMSTELYDCCGSSAVETTCTTFGTINAVLLGLILAGWIVLLVKSQWFRA